MKHLRVLYFMGCPNHPPIVERARQLIAEHGVDCTIEEIDVAPEDVEQLRFLGSPTVQVDGVDIEPQARTRTDYAMSCRVYDTPDGLPSRELLEQALGIDAPIDDGPRSGPASEPGGGSGSGSAGEPAGGSGGKATGFVATIGAIVTASLSSACCWVPLVLLSVGASAAGVSMFFERWRPVLIVLAVVMLAIGFWTTYRPIKVCADGCCTTRPRRSGRIQRAMLWVSAAVVGGFIFFPNALTMITNTSNANQRTVAVANTNNGQQAVFDLDGLSCEACAVTIKGQLAKIDGVEDVSIDDDLSTARMRLADKVSPETVVETITRAGFAAKARTPSGPTPDQQ